MRQPVVAVFSSASGTSIAPTRMCTLIICCSESKVTHSTRNSTSNSTPAQAVSRALPAGPPVRGSAGSSRCASPRAVVTTSPTGAGRRRRTCSYGMRQLYPGLLAAGWVAPVNRLGTGSGRGVARAQVDEGGCLEPDRVAGRALDGVDRLRVRPRRVAEVEEQRHRDAAGEHVHDGGSRHGSLLGRGLDRKIRITKV